MKKTTVIVAVMFLWIAFASATSRSKLTEINGAGGDPRSVPGSINRGNGAIVKTGYKFVRRGNEVDVVEARGRFKTGTYVCSCRGSANQACELLFSPRQIFCKQGSCSGVSCMLTPIESAQSQ